MKKSVAFPVALVFLLLFSGCVQNICPECPEPSSYSECNDQAIKTRTNYRCNEATDFECESYTEETQCATEITLSGNIDATVKPSIEEKVQGIIRIEVKNVPDDTKIVAYYLEGGGLPPLGSERSPLFATKKDDIWSGMLDTAEYENGLYEMVVGGSTVEELKGRPQYYARGQILISN